MNKPLASLTAVIVTCLLGRSAAGATIHVPNDSPSIQQAIDMLGTTGTIFVHPGVYSEAIDFQGKAIHLRSVKGPETTIIDATQVSGNVSAVTCANGEGPGTILEGFTIRGGHGQFIDGFYRGGGMYNLNASPTIINCIFQDALLRDPGLGSGMYNENSHPLILDCAFKDNEGVFGNLGGNTGAPTCPGPPPGDLNGDGVVDVSDLLILLAAWGPCPRSGDCPADLNGDGAVDVSDLLILLANWG